jgi:inorganic triphosphatase YgiF
MIGRPHGADARPVEVELKYRLATLAAGERYLKADELAGFRPATRITTTQLEDRYLDTAEGALARAGFAARLRSSRTSTVISVKSTARNDDAVHRREELEGAADRMSGPLGWPASDARSLVLELCGDAPLVEIVTIRQLRRHRELRDELAAVELSLDEVDVVSRSRVVDRFAELEVELIRGEEQRLDDVAAVLRADPALDGSRGSKLETALAAAKAHARGRSL